MTFDVERLDVMKRFLRLEFKATVVLAVRAIPSVLVWGAVVLWALN